MSHTKKAAIGCAVAIVLALAGLGVYFVLARGSGDVAIDESAYYPVSYVVDGDTFKADIKGHEITVRMLGMDTPETVDPRKPVQCYGPEASAETKSLLSGHSIRLAFNPDRERKDKYGRYLAYVYIAGPSSRPNDELFVNKFLLENGYAREYSYSKSKPYSFVDEFKGAEAAAKEAKKGLWGKCEDTESRAVIKA